MVIKSLVASICLVFELSVGCQAAVLVEPRLTIKLGVQHGPYVALTFDACTGHVDERILRALIDHGIRSTIFVTARWLQRNPKAVEDIKAHPELFEVENHGARHAPAIDVPMTVFGLKAAGSAQAVHEEVMGGAEAMEQTFGHKPKWFRGATGKYTAQSMAQIQGMNFRIAGYSVLGDGGASFSTRRTAATIAGAKDGDVIVAHINQPNKPAGAGVVEGILKLKKAGFIFLRLEDGV